VNVLLDESAKLRRGVGRGFVMKLAEIMDNCTEFRKFESESSPWIGIPEASAETQRLPVHGAQSLQMVIRGWKRVQFPISEVFLRIEVIETG
jgi:hypothetical protein